MRTDHEFSPTKAWRRPKPKGFLAKRRKARKVSRESRRRNR